MAQHFHGYLAGLSLLNNKTEDDQVISCLNECQEKLELTTIDTMDDTVTPWPAHFHNLHLPLSWAAKASVMSWDQPNSRFHGRDISVKLAFFRKNA